MSLVDNTSRVLGTLNSAGAAYPATFGYASTDLGSVFPMLRARVQSLMYTQKMLTKLIDINLGSGTDFGRGRPGTVVNIPFVGDGTIPAVQTPGGSDPVTFSKASMNTIGIELDDYLANGIQVQLLNQQLTSDFDRIFSEFKTQSVMPVLDAINDSVCAQYANFTHSIQATGVDSETGDTYITPRDIEMIRAKITGYKTSYVDFSDLNLVMNPSSAAYYRLAQASSLTANPEAYKAYATNSMPSYAGVKLHEHLNVFYTDYAGVRTYYNPIFARSAIKGVARYPIEPMNEGGLSVVVEGSDIIGFPYTIEKFMTYNPAMDNMIFRVLMTIETLHPNNCGYITTTVNL